MTLANNKLGMTECVSKQKHIFLSGPQIGMEVYLVYFYCQCLCLE